jgi:outer membrane immunogenic protein
MRILIVAGVGLAALAAGPAVAADMPVKAPPPVVAPQWTGGYAGVGVGGEWSSDRWTTTCFNPNGSLSVPSSVCGSSANLSTFPIDRTSPHTFHPTGVRASFYAGYVWQFSSNWVAGVEVDAAWSDGSNTFGAIPGCAVGGVCDIGGSPGFDSTRVRVLGDGSLRGRLGFLITPDWLVYGTGGFAVEAIKTSLTCNAAGSTFCTFAVNAVPQTLTDSIRNTLPGWTVGGGLEYKWGHWVARGEYRFSEFQRTDFTFFQDPKFGQAIHVRLRPESQIAYFGLSYLFYSEAAPVRASY